MLLAICPPDWILLFQLRGEYTGPSGHTGDLLFCFLLQSGSGFIQIEDSGCLYYAVIPYLLMKWTCI